MRRHRLRDILSDLCLTLDACGRFLQCGIFAGKAIGVHSELAPRESFQRLIPSLQQLLSSHNVRRPDWILCGRGPGSFTGIRVTLSAARTLAQVWEAPVLTINSLHYYLYSAMLQNDHGNAAILLDARQGRVYATAADTIEWLTPPPTVDAPPLLWLEQVDAACRLYTDDLGAVRPLLESRPDLQQRLEAMPEPRLADLFRLAIELGGKDAARHWSLALPEYLRLDPAHARYPQGINQL